MPLDDVIDLSITANTRTPSRAGFGTPMFMVCHSVTPNVVDSYASPTEMTDAGWPVTHPGYLMAQKAFSQNPRPTKIVIGKRALKHTKMVRLFPLNSTTGFHYQFTVVGVNGTSVIIDYVVTVGQTIAQIITAIVALLGAVNGVTVSGTATYIQFIATVAGTLFDLQNLPNTTDAKVLDTTTDPGVVTDYTAIKAVDFKSWYSVHLDSCSPAEEAALAAAVEADRRIFIGDSVETRDTDNADSTDVLSVLKALNLARTGTAFSSRSLLSYLAIAWTAEMLPNDPGDNTWCFKTPVGVTVDNIPSGLQTSIANKNGNFFVDLGGISCMQKGVMAGGSFIDVTIFLDWLHARIQEAIIGILTSSKKIPYTDSGADTVRGAIAAVLDRGIKVGGLAATPAPTILIPKVADVDPIDRANRFLPDITFQARLAGAIQSMKIGGTISV